ncbi:hypothetical protein HY604_04305 [Candidatus Peregrinibacteria bacterium]|nr:hypothetical protein [Candidatus Peregrinibacteria bacterium]
MKRKFLAAILAIAFLAVNTLGFNQQTAHAEWNFEWPKFEWPKIELPKFEWPKLEWPKFELPKFTIPGTNIEIDPDLGFEGIKKLVDTFKLPDEIDIPGTPYKIYTKEDLGQNLIKNLTPFVSDAAGFLNPLKPAASIAKMVLKMARPYIEPLIRQILPAPVKGAFWNVKQQINSLVRSIDIPVIKNVLFALWDIFVGPLDDLAIEIIDILAEEDKARAEGRPVQEIVGEPPEMILSKPFVNEKPIGYFDNVDENGIATGWALDPNDPGKSITVRIRIWAQTGNLVFEIPTDQPRPDVNQPGNHGFRFRIPSSVRNGNSNAIDAYGIDIDDAKIEVELPTTKRFRLYEKASGILENIDTDGNITGWAIDPDKENTAALVKIYLDDTRHLGDVATSIPRPDLKETIAQAFNITARNNVGFKVKINPDEYRDGIRHKLTAFVINQNDKGEVARYKLGQELFFMFPEVLKVSFAKDPITVQQGSRVFNTIIGVGNKNHDAIVSIDGKLIDVNADKHGYPFNNAATDIVITNDKTNAKTRSFDFSFKTPQDLPLGEHTVTIESGKYAGPVQGFVYKGSFKINVIPYETMQVTVPAEVVTESPFDITISKIPRQIHFSGKDKNATIKGVAFTGDKGGFNTETEAIQENSDGTITLHLNLPYEANSMRTDRGPVEITLRVDYDTDLAMEEFRAQKDFSMGYFKGKTAEGKQAIFTPNCKSTLKPILNLKGGSGYVDGSATGFGCNQKFSVTISGENEGRPFSVSLPNTSKTPSPIISYVDETAWDGSIPQFGMRTNEIWARDYTAVEEITITITDTQGNSASAKISMPSPYQVKILPLKGDKLIPGEDIKLILKGFYNKVSLSIDGESWRQIYLTKENIKTDENGLIYYSGLYMPTWITPGVHKLIAEESTYIDGQGDVFYKAQSSFIIEGNTAPEDEKNDNNNKTGPEKKKKSPPTVSVNPTTAKAGNSFEITATGFSPLGTMTIYIRPASSPDEGGTKLSGYADYSDSDGALTKTATIPSALTPGAYKIVVTDIEGLKATADLTIEAAPKPKPKPKPVIPTIKPEPTPETTPKPTSEPEPYVEPEPEPEPESEPEPEKAPTCPDGFSYSPTFKQCLEDAPQSSPFEGLPCDDNIPLYAQKGCIQQ